MSDRLSLREDVDRVLGDRFARTVAGLTASTQGPVHLEGEPHERIQMAIEVREQILVLTDKFDELLRGV